jgi:biopolymer transport protein ExbD
MKTSSFTKKTEKRSPLAEVQSLKPGVKSGRSKKAHLALELPLTSLIDAFSIIVIYLLIGTQTSGLETAIPSKMTLPTASHSQTIDKESPTISIQKGVYRLNEKIVSVQRLAEELKALRAKNKEAAAELIVQADQEMRYQDLDPLLKASSASGFEKMKFAVVPAQ